MCDSSGLHLQQASTARAAHRVGQGVIVTAEADEHSIMERAGQKCNMQSSYGLWVALAGLPICTVLVKQTLI